MKIFCIGIGGIGMSAVAQILHAEGHEVSGVDASASEITQYLNDHEITVVHEHRSENISDDTDLVVYSEAVPGSNPERQAAKEKNIRQINYAEALGELSREKRTIAITGTHGKTTVTGMMTSVLLAAQMDPTIVIGSKIDLLGENNFRVGKSNLFLTEACEYRDNFLHLSPDIVLINNLEPDHLDYFKTAENYYNSFQTLIEKVPEKGLIILFSEDAKKLDFSNVKARRKVISQELCTPEVFPLAVPGKHNAHNADATIAIAQELGISTNIIRAGLKNFKGTWRRFEYKGLLNGAKVFDDYGHHPTEIEATLQGAREWFPDKKLIVIFQPHQYSRTRVLFDEFKTSFTQSNEAWITDIYQARDSEEDIKAVSAEKLAEHLEGNIVNRFVPMNDLAYEMEKNADPNTVFIVMGAGSIHKLFEELNLHVESSLGS